MANIVQGSGNYGVIIKWNGGGTTTYYYKDNSTRNSAFKRIKGEVTNKDKVSKKDR